MEEKFDYKSAIAQLEAMVEKVEDPATGLEDIDKLIKKSDEIIVQCRNYLRAVRETVENLDK